jgi:hypothetical protein
VGYIRSSPEVLDSGLPPSITGYRAQKRHTWQGVLEETWIVTPHLVNVAKFGLTHTENHFGGDLQGQPLVNALGINGFPVACFCGAGHLRVAARIRARSLAVSTEGFCPAVRKRCFQRLIVGAVVPSRTLMVLYEAPSASIRISLARKTYPAGKERH